MCIIYANNPHPTLSVTQYDDGAAALVEYDSNAESVGQVSYEDDANWEYQEPIDNPPFWLNTVTGETRWPGADS